MVQFKTGSNVTIVSVVDVFTLVVYCPISKGSYPLYGHYIIIYEKYDSEQSNPLKIRI
jgi:hypothetical protein